MAEDSDLERTESPSDRRLEQAREEGQVPQSRELAAFMVLFAAVLGFATMGDWLAGEARGIVRHGLSFGHDEAFNAHAMANAFVSLSADALLLAAPLFLLCVAATLATPFLLGAWVFSPKALSLDFSRLNPGRGLARMFSMHGIGELVKAILKAALVGVIVYGLVRYERDELFALLAQPLETSLVSFTRLLRFSAMLLVAGVALIAAIDVPFQLWQYYSRLRMSKQELRDEAKESEGDPQLKARVRSQQREMARRRMMSEVPKADVVVTNPTHYAVALKYEAKRMAAPVVVAKGMNLIAEKIREAAREHDVPLLEAPPLARALYRHTDVGDQIPAPLYTAVAEVMAYVYQLGQYLAGAKVAEPVAPTGLGVPPAMDPQAA